MSILVYNSQSLEILRVVKFDTRPIYTEDGIDVALLHCVLGAECILNPKATAVDDDDLPMKTLPKLHDKMLQPRKRLIVTDVEGNVSVDLPEVGMDTDARGGPKPLAFNVYRFAGTSSAVCYFEIEFYKSFNCPGKDVSVLTHRWHTSQEVDKLGYTTKTIEGEAVFRMDRLLKTGTMPDDFRERLFHPLSNFCRRESIWVQQTAPNATRYRVVDREVPFSTGRYLPDGTTLNPIQEIRGWLHYGYASERWIGFRNQMASVTIEVFGNRNALRNDLIRYAMKAASGYGFTGGISGRNATPGYSADIDVDLAGKYVQFRSGFITGGSFVRTLAEDAPFEIINTLQFPEDGLKYGTGLYADFSREEIEDSKLTAAQKDFRRGLGDTVLDRNVPDRPAPVDNPFHEKLGARGTLLEKLVSQALHGVCATPTSPALRVGTNDRWSFGVDPRFKG